MRQVMLESKYILFTDPTRYTTNNVIMRKNVDSMICDKNK